MGDFNPHPPLASIPFVLGGVLLILELLARRKEERALGAAAAAAPVVLLLLGVITPLTYLTGYTGATFADQAFSVPASAIATHQAYGKFLLLLLFPVLVLAFARGFAKGESKELIGSLYVLSVALFLGVAGWTSYLGGELVFTHGAGVSATAVPAAQEEVPVGQREPQP